MVGERRKPKEEAHWNSCSRYRPMTRYGYAAMNVTLREEDDVRTNRGMRKATFEERGLEYAGELA